jgi:hypothetical protein
MGYRLGNTTTADPADGVSVWHLIADGLCHAAAAGDTASEVAARTALSQRTHVLGQTFKGIHTECGPNELYVLMDR